MSPAGSAAHGRSERSGGGRGALTALIIVGAAIGLLLLIRSGSSVKPFDPRSSAANGATGAVLLLEHYGATVDISTTVPQPGASSRVFIISDALTSSQRQQVLAFAAAGGVAVVADPSSTLHGGVSTGAAHVSGEAPDDDVPLDAIDEADIDRGDCTIGSLQSLRGVFTPSGLLFSTAASQPHCFTQLDQSFVITRSVGSGFVIGFGDNHVVTNQYLRDADNAGLVTALLAPQPGAHVSIVIGTGPAPASTEIGKGDETLLDLVRPGLWMALAQVALAFVVFCIARGVRPGRAVREPKPTSIAGNELVVATGNLMQRAQHADRAGWLLRAELHRQLCAHLGVAADTPIDRLSDIVARRTGASASELRSVLAADTTTAEQLLQLSARVEAVRAVAIGSPQHEPTHQDEQLMGAR